MWGTGAVLYLLMAAFAALLVHEDPREYRTLTAVYGEGDVITYWEAALAFVLAGLAVGLGWWSSPPPVGAGKMPEQGMAPTAV